MCKSRYLTVKHIRYEVESDSGKRVFIIPNILDIPDMKNVLCLSETSLEIWEMIVKGLTKTQIIDYLCTVYHQDKACIENDVSEFINNLAGKKFICLEQEIKNG